MLISIAHLIIYNQGAKKYTNKQWGNGGPIGMSLNLDVGHYCFLELSELSTRQEFRHAVRFLVFAWGPDDSEEAVSTGAVVPQAGNDELYRCDG